ncbi:MAG: KpsF/GutQ family sugar-phosphate isomerase [Pseudomonadota bacterium]
MGQAVIDVEAQAVAALRARIDDAFVLACRHMLACLGRIVVLGMGKSGHIGSKIAATLASTGSPAFFVHPGEASHGDLGMITAQDVVVAISNSGETAEILTILPLIKRLGAPLIALSGNPQSTLGRMASVFLDVSVEKEACPLGLAPTASTTATLAMGDALAIAMLEARGFTEIDFARSHPGGSLGRRLLLLIDDVMLSDAAVPSVLSDALLADALIEMNKKGLGFTTIVDAQRRLAGVFTDGDLRRVLVAQVDIRNARIVDVMTANCRSIRQGVLAAEALQVMQKYKVNALPVVDAELRVVGAFNMQSMLRAGVV